MTALLTYCACIDPRRINPSTGHYPGCPDSIIPPDRRAIASALAGRWKSHWMPWCPGCHARFEQTWRQ